MGCTLHQDLLQLRGKADQETPARARLEGTSRYLRRTAGTSHGGPVPIEGIKMSLPQVARGWMKPLAAPIPDGELQSAGNDHHGQISDWTQFCFSVEAQTTAAVRQGI